MNFSVFNYLSHLSLDFTVFISELIANNDYIRENIDNYTFIFDNYKTYHARCTKEYLNENFYIIYTSPFSPF